MALTIRTLSAKANQSLDEILENNYFINSKSKAIQYALENHYLIKKYEKKLFQVNDKIHQLEIELDEYKEAFRTLNRLMQKADL